MIRSDYRNMGILCQVWILPSSAKKKLVNPRNVRSMAFAWPLVKMKHFCEEGFRRRTRSHGGAGVLMGGSGLFMPAVMVICGVYDVLCCFIIGCVDVGGRWI